MKPTDNIVSAGLGHVQREQVDSAELARSQWRLIQAFEQGYLGKQVLNTRCDYEAEEWFDLTGSSSSRTGLKWATWSSAPALKILVKAMMWDLIFDRSLEISSARLRLHSIRKTILPVIDSKNLLAGQPGDVLLGLSHITEDDLLALLDAQLVSAPNESNYLSTCSDLNGFITYARHYGQRVPTYLIRTQLPWEKSGEAVKAWAKRRASDLKYIFPQIEGHEPLSGGTAQPLVETSLLLIDDHFDHFSEIGPIVAEYTVHSSRDGHYLKSVGRQFALGLLEKYSPIFGYIMPPPDLSERSAFLNKGRAVFLWLRALIKLCRAACINIILLTSGLRNEDIRRLKIRACTPSGRVDILFYLRADIQKTGNVVILPVPPQAEKAIRLLENIKDTKSSVLIDWGWESKKGFEIEELEEAGGDDTEDDTYLKTGHSINAAVRSFAEHFNIPFTDSKGASYSAHNYRTTVAGWLGSASNLSLLLVRRLFGHSNNAMPTVYLNNNPAFISEREAQKKRANAETARQMALAASQGRVAGVKGEQLERGYKAHKSRMLSDTRKSHSLTDAEIMISFASILEQRIDSGSVCGFLTPFGVMCARNPTDSSQTACAKRAHRDKTREIPIEVLNHISDINPQQCVGTSCSEAMLGPWSTAVLESVIWYRALLNHQLGEAFNESHFIESAKQFIRQYEAPIKKVFGIEALDNTLPNVEVGNG